MIRHWRRITELARARKVTPAWREVASRYLQIGSPSYPYQIPLAGGGTIQTTSPNEVKVFWQIFVRHCYRVPPDCTTIVDAGANIGVFALWAAGELPGARIISLEPFPQTFRLLEENIHANGLQGRISPVQRALASENGKREMNTGGASPRRRLILDGQPGGDAPTVTVSCSTLTDFLREQHLETLDLLKMDVEGSEWEILFSTPPSVLGSIRHIILEYHEVHARFQYQPEKLFAHLASAGQKLTYREEDRSHTGLAFFSRM